MESYNFYKFKLKSILSEKRYIHSVNVSECCEELAKKYKIKNVESIKIAGLLHDICKEMPDNELQYLLSLADKNISDLFENCTIKLYHGPAGAEYLKREFGILDEDILNAVRYHTVGRKNMTLPEKIVFVADYISIERPYSDIFKMRELALKDIDKVVLHKCSLEIKKCIDKKSKIHTNTFETYNFIVNKVYVK